MVWIVEKDREGYFPTAYSWKDNIPLPKPSKGGDIKTFENPTEAADYLLDIQGKESHKMICPKCKNVYHPLPKIALNKQLLYPTIHDCEECGTRYDKEGNIR